MRLILNQPEMGDVPGVRKSAQVYRTPLALIGADLGDRYFANFEEARAAFPDVPWVGLEVTNKSVPLEDFDFDQFPNDDYVLITGSMNHGLPQEILDQLDAFVKVERFDDSGFLSPTVAVGIFLYERFKHFVAKEHRG